MGLELDKDRELGFEIPNLDLVMEGTRSDQICTQLDRWKERYPGYSDHENEIIKKFGLQKIIKIYISILFLFLSLSPM